jgi:threonyl-tRNA synthetase
METAYIALATRPEVRAGPDEFWDKAEAMMAEAARAGRDRAHHRRGRRRLLRAQARLHGQGRHRPEWTCGTLQLDYVLPERLGAEYIGEDGGSTGR